MIDRRRRRLRSTALAGGRVIPRVALVGFWKTYDSVSGTFPDKYGQYPITATGQTGPYFEAGATYTMANNATLRGLLGHTDGAASTFYGADNLPVAVSYYTLLEFAVGPRLFYNPSRANKGMALYSTDKTVSEELNIWQAMGSLYALPTPTAFFNGIDPTGMTSFTGGSTTFVDVDGKLRIAPTNSLAKTGMRVATTVAEGATLGSEIITVTADREFSSDTGFWTKNTWTIGSGTANASALAAGVNLSRASLLTIGKRYRLTFDISSYIAGAVILAAATGADVAHNIPGVQTVEFIALATTFTITTSGASTTLSIDNISIKEVIPTYSDLKQDGTPIVSSTDQVTRTGDANFQVFTNNPAVKRYSIANPLAMPGFLCEPARTNKVTCMKRNPTVTTNITKSGDAASVLSIVNDASALVAAGLDQLCTSGMVYKLDNSGGSTTAYATIGGTTGNTNIHAISCYFRSGGTGLASGIDLDDMASPVRSSSTSYVFLKKENITPGASTRSMSVEARAGAVSYFILPQLEEGAFATSPICQLDQTAAESRLATVLTYPTAGKIRSNNMAFRMIVVPRSSAIGSSYPKIFSSYIDLNNSISVQIAPTAIEFRKMAAGFITSASVSHTIDSNLYPIDVLFITTASYGMICAKRSFVGGSWSSWTNGTPVTTTAGKGNGMIAATFQLGAFSAGNQFTGNISLFDTLPIPAGVTDPLAWAKQQWGIA